MDQQQAAGPSTPIEEALTPLATDQTETHSIDGADTIYVSQAPEGESSGAPASAEMVDSDDTQAQDSTSDVDDANSDYVPTRADAEEDSDDEISASRKKRATKAEVDPPEIEELHEKWSKWEDIYSDLLSKEKSATLDEDEKEELLYSRRKLGEIFKRIPASDPLKKRYGEILLYAPSSSESVIRKRNHTETRKRKSTETRTGSSKKTRRTQTRQSQRVTSEVSQINKQMIDFRKQCAEAGLEPKRLKSEVKNMENALTTFGEEAVTAKDGCWLVKGMKTPLYNYQFDAAGWAMRRERSQRTPDNPKGGILADEMGCGKTITLLAVLMAKPAPKTYKVKANLLLVQSAEMVNQWQKQIKKHCVSLNGDQVIITTYSEVQRAWARLRTTSRKQKTKAEDDESEDEEDGNLASTEQEQLLFESTFHRLILDECQFIKQHNSATAKAVFQLKSKIQWLISATPAPNSQDEYFSYLKLFGLRNTEDLGAFRRYWPKSKSWTDSRRNLEIGLEKFQLHRTHQTRIAGIPIFYDVPNSISEERTVTMSSEERAMYNAVVAPVEQERKDLVAKMTERQMGLTKKGLSALGEDFMRTSKGVEAKILHFHKLTAHPFLLETIIRNKDFSKAELMKIRDIMKQSQGFALLDEAEEIFAKVGPSGYGRSPSMDSQFLDSAPTSQGGHEQTSMDFKFGFALAEKAAERKCHFCPGESIPINAILTECGHAFCPKHFDTMLKLSRIDNPEGPDSCSVCEQPVGTHKEVDQTELVTARAEFMSAGGPSIGGYGTCTRRSEKRVRKRGDDFNGYQPKGIQSLWLAASDRSHPKVPLIQSSKTRAVLDTIERWQDDGPDDKIIIFTQWVMMGKILGRCLQDSGIEFLYYFGEMSNSERNKNLQVFETNKDIKVMIMGFRCASQGLDMFYANRVILVDPWWNDDGEEQGFARVKRKVQKKATFFMRLMAEDTIDMRVAEIKKSKREMTQLLRKEDDPWRRLEIELEYALKTCKLKLSAESSDTGPIKCSEQNATSQRGTMYTNATDDEKEAESTASE